MKTRLLTFVPFFYIIFILISCSFSSIFSNFIPVKTEFTYLALGDSYTIGESVPISDRWSMQLKEMLVKEGIHLSDPDFIAKTGWTTSELSTAITQSKNTNKYSMVSLLIGVNNQYRGQSVTVYRKEFKELLQTAIAFADNKPQRVFVLSIPDWGVTPFANGHSQELIAKEIDNFNFVAKKECLKAKIAFIDITPVSRTALRDASMVASDQLHFSGKMYQFWAEKSLSTAKDILK